MTTNPLSPDELVERVARAICWAFSEETDDCSSVCLNAKRCMTDDVADSFKRDARAAIAAMPELAELQQRVKQLEEALRALFELWDNYQDSDLSQMHAHDRLVRWEVWSAARKALEARKSRSLLSDKGEDK